MNRRWATVYNGYSSGTAAGAPYQGNLGYFSNAAEQIPCKLNYILSS
jgi:hypothetical protein